MVGDDVRSRAWLKHPAGASKLETSRAEGALGAAEASIPQLESDIVAKENQISILLGRNPAPIPRGLPMYAQAVVPTVPAGLPSALLERRPDLRQAEQQLVGANARIGVAQAEFFLKLSLTALLGTASLEVSALTGGSATIWAVAGMADRSSTRAAPSATTGRPSRSGSRRSSNTSRRCSPRSGRSRMLTLLVKLTRR